MDELVAFIRAALDEEQAEAQAATTGPWDWGIPNPRYWVRTEEGPASEDLLCNESGQWVLMTSKAGAVSAPNARHIARWDPARVLAEVEAKRLILDSCMAADHGKTAHVFASAEDEERQPMCAVCFTYPSQHLAGDLIVVLAQVYRARPGFKDEWRLT